MDYKDKIRGCFLGIGIGDGLGLPVECWPYARIAEKYGRITDYFVNPDHKYFAGQLTGGTSDDLQLSLAVARGLIYAEGFDMDSIAEEHCKEFILNINGWGNTTKKAVCRIVDGCHWSEAAELKEGMGTGNGVAMKVAPIGLYMALTNPSCNQPQFSEDVQKLVHFAIMTHFTSMAISSGIAQAFAISKCFLSNPNSFDMGSFIRTLVAGSEIGRRYLFGNKNNTDNLTERLKLLENHTYYPASRIIEEFKGGSYVYESLPFALMFFVKNPFSIDALYDCISSGGDTDSTGAIVGALLGALHGTKIFPQHLIDGLHNKEVIFKIADDFSEKFLNQK